MQLQTVLDKIGIVGESPVWTAIIDKAAKVSRFGGIPILIEGETGTGKEKLASFIHQLSLGRDVKADHAYSVVNCANLNNELAESTLFGHKKGAFTGATAERIGAIRAAQGGTLFLDEIGELDLDVQAKLLRVLQDGKVKMVGDDNDIKVGFRLVAATNRPLPTFVESKKFRADLYHRISVFTIKIPPLRERKADIPVLARHFVDDFCKQHELQPVSIDETFLAALCVMPWPGNVRQLQNTIASVLINHYPCLQLTGSHLVEQTISDAPECDLKLKSGKDWNFNEAMDEYEYSLVTNAIKATPNHTKAAEFLGIYYSTFRQKIAKFLKKGWMKMPEKMKEAV